MKKRKWQPPFTYPELLKDPVGLAKEAYDLERRLQWIQSNCQHPFVAKPPEHLKNESFAYCAVCGHSMDTWYCPESPTQICELEGELPENPMDLSECSCKHCKLPLYERNCASDEDSGPFNLYTPK